MDDIIKTEDFFFGSILLDENFLIIFLGSIKYIDLLEFMTELDI